MLRGEKTDRSLDQIVDYIAREEQAKLEQGVITTIHCNNAALQSKIERICRQCHWKDHGSKAFRLKEYPAKDHVREKCKAKGLFSKTCLKCKNCGGWGHGSKQSRKCSMNNSDKNENTAEVESMEISALVSTFVGRSMEDIFDLSDLELATVDRIDVRRIPLNHQIFVNGVGRQSKQAELHPTMIMDMKPCKKDHEVFGFEVPINRTLKKIPIEVVCDTGCMSTVLPPNAAYKMGFKKKDFMPVVSRINGTGKSD